MFKARGILVINYEIIVLAILPASVIRLFVFMAMTARMNENQD